MGVFVPGGNNGGGRGGAASVVLEETETAVLCCCWWAWTCLGGGLARLLFLTQSGRGSALLLVEPVDLMEAFLRLGAMMGGTGEKKRLAGVTFW